MKWLVSKADLESAIRAVVNGEESHPSTRKLREEIARLEIERNKKKEEWDRREREIED